MWLPAKCRDFVAPCAGARVGGTRYPPRHKAPWHKVTCTRLPGTMSWHKVAGTKFGAQPRTDFMDSMCLHPPSPAPPPNNVIICMCLMIVSGGWSNHLPQPPSPFWVCGKHSLPPTSRRLSEKSWGGTPRPHSHGKPGGWGLVQGRHKVRLKVGTDQGRVADNLPIVITESTPIPR